MIRALVLLALCGVAAADVSVPAKKTGLRSTKCLPVPKSWGVDVTIDLTMRTVADRATVTGTVSWPERRTRARLEGRADKLLDGTLSEIGGLGTIWKVRLITQPRPDGGTRFLLLEMIEDSEPAVICAFDS